MSPTLARVSTPPPGGCSVVIMGPDSPGMSVARRVRSGAWWRTPCFMCRSSTSTCHPTDRNSNPPCQPYKRSNWPSLGWVASFEAASSRESNQSTALSKVSIPLSLKRLPKNVKSFSENYENRYPLNEVAKVVGRKLWKVRRKLWKFWKKIMEIDTGRG